jgi:hypothetical protein
MSSAQKPVFVLFMMPSCEYSNTFLGKLKSKEELIKKFNIVDITTINVPDEIEEVPAVYDGNNLHQGKKAFKWLNEKMKEYLSPANDGMLYSFVNGQEEPVFGNYSLIDQKNGSFGMGEGGVDSTNGDPTRMAAINNNDNKNRTLDSLMASRSSDIKPL